MTTTTVINAQSFGTSTNVGNGKFAPAATALQATTTAFVVNAKVTLGTDQAKRPNKTLRVWYTTCVDSVAAGDCVSQLAGTAHYVDVPLDRTVRSEDSMLEPITGGFFNCWVDAPNLDVASTLTVKLVELP